MATVSNSESTLAVFKQQLRIELPCSAHKNILLVLLQFIHIAYKGSSVSVSLQSSQFFCNCELESIASFSIYLAFTITCAHPIFTSK